MKCFQYAMFKSFLLIFCYTELGQARLWPKGVVHYAINKKDYDLHSQEVIAETLSSISKEVCLKFFNTPQNYTAADKSKILYISNPEKKKGCAPEHYDFSKNVVDMVIGYKCMNQKDIARVVVDMLRASIEQSVPIINSYELVRKFQERLKGNAKSLLAPVDRNFINAHYHSECGSLEQLGLGLRTKQENEDQLSADNVQFYKDKLWPLGIVMYGVDETLRDTKHFSPLKYAMATIEMSSCIVFQEIKTSDVLAPKNWLWFGQAGDGMPQYGFTEGKQELNLKDFTEGTPGHEAHTLNNLLRVVGVPMMSNRHDRDNYVIINWKHVEKGKEVYLERMPIQAWIVGVGYDFDSATHAPANYMCSDCELGAQTVQPVQDHLWQRSINMGHKTTLSESDVFLTNLLYTKQCNNRYMNKEIKK